MTDAPPKPEQKIPEGARVVNGTIISNDGKLLGRVKGIPNKATALLREAQREIALKFGVRNFHPVTFLLACAADETLDRKLRMDAAKGAAPYVAPTLKSVELSGPDGGPVQTADVSEVMLEAAKAAKLPISDLSDLGAAIGVGNAQPELEEVDEEFERLVDEAAARRVDELKEHAKPKSQKEIEADAQLLGAQVGA